MIGAIQYSEDTIKITVKTPQTDLFGADWPYRKQRMKY
jgi:hypothetical protein